MAAPATSWHPRWVSTPDLAPALLVVYDDTGRWDVSPLDASRVRIRAAGPGETAPLESPEAATRTDGLVGLFLSGQ